MFLIKTYSYQIISAFVCMKMCLFSPRSWKIYSWSIEYWVISLDPRHGRSTHLPFSIGAVKSHLMALIFLLWTMFFLSVKIFYLSLLFQRFIIMSGHRQISLHFTSLVFVRVLKLYNGDLINSEKLLSLKNYCYPSPLSSPSRTPVNSVMPFQSLSKYLNLSFIVNIALSLCAALWIITVITAKKKTQHLRRMVNMEKKLSDKKYEVRKSNIM